MAVVEITAIDDGIATLTLQGGRANALGDAFCSALHEAIEQAREDERIRGVLLTGSGRFFSAGRDLREADETRPGRRSNNSFEMAMRAAFSFPKPMVAAVNGHAVAGGLVLALAADYCVLVEGDYKLGLTELDIGLPFPRVAFEILRCALPPAAITRLAYGADLIGPKEAHQLGVGQELAPADQLTQRALAWLWPVAERPQQPFALCKRWLRAEAVGRIEGQSDEERRATAEVSASAESRARLAGYAKRLRGE
ncbi:MAG: enoyl-CoA hydratase/isomerase family protein [Dehalococcoidia bacterium]